MVTRFRLNLTSCMYTIEDEGKRIISHLKKRKLYRTNLLFNGGGGRVELTNILRHGTRTPDYNSLWLSNESQLLDFDDAENALAYTWDKTPSVLTVYNGDHFREAEVNEVLEGLGGFGTKFFINPEAKLDALLAFDSLKISYLPLFSTSCPRLCSASLRSPSLRSGHII